MSHFDLNFYKNKKVLITGHTGFKGSWLCRMLLDLGADVTGYSLEPPTDPSLFNHIFPKFPAIFTRISEIFFIS